jgi:predicted MFS family arabinose efflux permease
MRFDGPPEERAAPPAARPRLPLVALLTADAISLTGNAMGFVAIPWFVLETTGSAALTGVVAALTFAPTVLAAFFGGAIVDRLGFRRTSVLADVASGVTVAAIPLLHATIGIELWQLFVLVFLGALFDAPGATARRSLLPDLVALSGTRLERATGINGAIQRGSLLVGAPIAGLLVAAIGATNVLWLNAATFAVSALLVARFVPVLAPHPDAPAPGRYLSELLTGVRFIAREPLMRMLVLTVLVTNFLDAPFPVVFPVFALEAFGSAVDLGVMLGVFGGAALVGSLAYSAVGHRLPRRQTFVFSFLLAALPYLGLSLLPSLPVTLVLMAAWGLASGPLNPLLATVAYERVPPHMRGRVLGATVAGAYLAIPAGALLGGLVVDRFGVGATLFGIGVCYLAVTSAGVFNPTLRQMDPVPNPEPSAA